MAYLIILIPLSRTNIPKWRCVPAAWVCTQFVFAELYRGCTERPVLQETTRFEELLLAAWTTHSTATARMQTNAGYKLTCSLLVTEGICSVWAPSAHELCWLYKEKLRNAATLDSSSTTGRSSAPQQLLPWATTQQSGASVTAVAKLSHSECSYDFKGFLWRLHILSLTIKKCSKL